MSFAASGGGSPRRRVVVDPRRDPFTALAGSLWCTCKFALALGSLRYYLLGPLAAPFGLFMWLATQRIEHSREIHINVHALAAYPTFLSRVLVADCGLPFDS